MQFTYCFFFVFVFFECWVLYLKINTCSIQWLSFDILHNICGCMLCGMLITANYIYFHIQSCTNYAVSCMIVFNNLWQQTTSIRAIGAAATMQMMRCAGLYVQCPSVHITNAPGTSASGHIQVIIVASSFLLQVNAPIHTVLLLILSDLSRLKPFSHRKWHKSHVHSNLFRNLHAAL